MDSARRRPLRILDHDDGWAWAFATIGAALRDHLDPAALRIDHIGSTAVAGLAAKDVIDIQVTVADLELARGWPHEILPDLLRRPDVTVDHLPFGLPSDAGEWAKLYWSNGSSFHLHPSTGPCGRAGRPGQATRSRRSGTLLGSTDW